VEIAQSPTGQKELLNEHQILNTLGGCVGVPRVVAWSNQLAILVTTPLGQTIKSYVSGMSRDQRRALTVTWSRQLCTILRAVHERGFIHRDIKPDNIVVVPQGTLRVIDFGSAIRMSQSLSSTPTGTPHYLADSLRTSGWATTRDDFESLAWSMHSIGNFMKGRIWTRCLPPVHLYLKLLGALLLLPTFSIMHQQLLTFVLFGRCSCHSFLCHAISYVKQIKTLY
jgi:serine/threonine protein kinase